MDDLTTMEANEQDCCFLTSGVSFQDICLGSVMRNPVKERVTELSSAASLRPDGEPGWARQVRQLGTCAPCGLGAAVGQ